MLQSARSQALRYCTSAGIGAGTAVAPRVCCEVDGLSLRATTRPNDFLASHKQSKACFDSSARSCRWCSVPQSTPVLRRGAGKERSSCASR